ncbi:hypothetical protein RGQ29_021794 [Quercus rubra]|uniref:Uncharacterized protein n=1 Tax=Quercus rubra TaxID=3512 RepID=A0AAN7F0T0_QUERU|nr:hypothetical protein RGQ29_021794 [Quercus rubra]
MGQCISRRAVQRERCNGSGAVCTEKHSGCVAILKEQRSRLYIARKCVVMLLCWHKYGK